MVTRGRNASIGPDLAGNSVSIEDARGRSRRAAVASPAGLVEGQDLEDVLAYLETIRAGDPCAARTSPGTGELDSGLSSRAPTVCRDVAG